MSVTGYERLAGFMAKHAEVATFQRFDFLNTLNILYLQAELVHLEGELRDSMKADLESGHEPSARNSGDFDSIRSAILPREGAESLSEKIATDTKCENGPEGKVRPASSAESIVNERVEGAKDWWYLSNSEHGQTWRIMLQVREKLKEYNEAVLRQKEMKSSHSPSTGDLDFLRRWFKDENMGNFPLIGRDHDLWENSSATELVAVKAWGGEDPLGSLFLNKAFRWWHQCVGRRFKKPVDEESQYFEYEDKVVLRVANILASIISSTLLVGSILALFFVNNMLVRLGIIAALTQFFSLVLILATNARKAEVFAATAAFVAVQVVFVESTYTPPTG